MQSPPLQADPLLLPSLTFVSRRKRNFRSKECPQTAHLVSTSNSDPAEIGMRCAQGTAARSGGVSAELALDWLCLALEPTQLPPKFAHGAHSASAAAGVRLVAVAAAEATARCDSHHRKTNNLFRSSTSLG